MGRLGYDFHGSYGMCMECVWDMYGIYIWDMYEIVFNKSHLSTETISICDPQHFTLNVLNVLLVSGSPVHFQCNPPVR